MGGLTKCGSQRGDKRKARAARVRPSRLDDLAAATRRYCIDHPPQEIDGPVDKDHDAPPDRGRSRS